MANRHKPNEAGDDAWYGKDATVPGAYDCRTAAAQPVVNTNYDDVQEGDVIRVDCDVAGTGTKGAELRLEFEMP